MVNNIPNSTIFGSTSLNFTTNPGWHLQNFSSPIFLNKGRYYLVLDGSSIPAYAVNWAGFYWAYNPVNPSNPLLYTSEYNSGWNPGINGEPLLYKLIRKINSTIFPENINMTTYLDNQSYRVSNGNVHGKGYLKRTNINYAANNKKVEVKIENNRSSVLNFNLTYNFNIFNVFNTDAYVSIKLNQTNNWFVNPIIERFTDNHTVKFEFPNSWTNIRVYKNEEDITSNVLNLIEQIIIIPNDTITNNADWEITANSPNIPINISAPINEFKTGQELSFSLNSLEGDYIFKLYDPSGIKKYELTKEIPLEEAFFSYLIPDNALEGQYTALIFWNNETDAGAQSKIFTISSITNNGAPTPINLTLIIIISTIGIGSVVTGFTGYKTVKIVEGKRRDRLNLILQQCNDVLNLKHVIVLDPKTGIDIYSQSFEKKELEPTLIAGFLQAIHNFGEQVLEGVKESKTVKVEYKESVILMTDFMNVRIITIMSRSPSVNFFYSLESLAYHIYKYYGKLIDNFQGHLKPFRSIKKLVDSDLHTSFRYPLTLSNFKMGKLKQNEKEMIHKASKFMKENDFSYFYAIYLLPENACGPKDYETIVALIKKGIFQPKEQDLDK
jgi:hypothetical protein